VDQQRLYPTELHVHPKPQVEEWHLTKEEQQAVNRYGTHSQAGLLPSVLYRNIKWQEPPGTPYSPGKPGQRARDNTYVYICVRNNLWKRALVEDTW
jgi:hypothetical protein